MNREPDTLRWLVAVGVALACHPGGARVQAQQKKADPAAGVWQLQPATDDLLDQWVFQRDRDAAGARKRLDAQLALQVEAIDRACALTDAQKQKLRLAGRGDIRRFFDRYEAVKQRFQLMRPDAQKLDELQPDIRPLQLTFARTVDTLVIANGTGCPVW